MNPLPFILIIVSLPLLLGGCGEEGGPIKKSVNKEEIEFRGQVVYLKGSDAPYTGKIFGLLDGRNFEFHTNDGKIDGPWVTWHQNGQKEDEGIFKDGKADGLMTSWYKNGQKEVEGTFKDGKPEGLMTWLHDNGQKKGEANFKAGEAISEKYWNSKVEEVDSLEEAEQ